ncbi:MAG: MBL fold metallo-hydrolase [Treponema sp.]|jgi:glyoxylase-like metal-dependent hydrolase (beta-lactamase superfamily II)|nr:MBL fold metallo-hydrolase [Treponema sp.]
MNTPALPPVIRVGDFRANCWFYPIEGPEAEGGARPCCLIDPGAEPERILEELRRQKRYAAFILLTHGHFDHLGALPQVRASDRVLAIHRRDAPYLGAESRSAHAEAFHHLGLDFLLNEVWRPLPEADRLLEDGETIGPFTVLHLPGHSPGSAGFYDAAAGVLFSGDTLFAGGGRGRCDLPGGDEAALRKSLARLMTLPPETLVCPGHGGVTTIGAERPRWD